MRISRPGHWLRIVASILWLLVPAYADAPAVRDNKAGETNGAGIYSREPKSAEFWGAVMGGSAATLAFISLGVLVIRRSKARAMK